MAKTKELPVGDPRELGFVPGRLDRIGRTMDAAVAKNDVPGTVTLVARRGRVVHTHVTGKLDMQRPAKLAIDSLFRMYSQTKPVTAAVLLTLFEEGAFLLDEPCRNGYRNSQIRKSSPITRRPNVCADARSPASNPRGGKSRYSIC